MTKVNELAIENHVEKMVSDYENSLITKMTKSEIIQEINYIDREMLDRGRETYVLFVKNRIKKLGIKKISCKHKTKDDLIETLICYRELSL